jgi:hypothetical protein
MCPVYLVDFQAVLPHTVSNASPLVRFLPLGSCLAGPLPLSAEALGAGEAASDLLEALSTPDFAARAAF